MKLLKFEEKLDEELQFAHEEKLGYLTTKPSSTGLALKFTIKILLKQD